MISLNYLAVLVAAVVAFAIGAVYYTVLGQAWMRALGWSEAAIAEARAKRKMPVGPMIVSFVAELIMALLLAGLVTHLGGGARTPLAGLITGAGAWLAFIVTTTAVNNAYEGRKIGLTVINAGHWLLVLLAQGLVIGLFG